LGRGLSVGKEILILIILSLLGTYLNGFAAGVELVSVDDVDERAEVELPPQGLGSGSRFSVPRCGFSGAAGISIGKTTYKHFMSLSYRKIRLDWNAYLLSLFVVYLI